MKIAFCSDIHLNFADAKINDFAKSLNDDDSDIVVIAGDIAEGHTLEHYLTLLSKRIVKSIFYVHGNHDFYFSDFHEIRLLSQDLTKSRDNLFWLPCAGIVELTDKTCLVGNDGWYDGQLGVFGKFQLADFMAIRPFAHRYEHELKKIFFDLAQESADQTKLLLNEALKDYEHVILVTHVPPFQDLAKFKGKPTEDYALPFFTSKVMGDAIKDVAARHLEKKITILCGHTHDKAEFTFNNIMGFCAPARYGNPQKYMDLEV